MTLRTVDELPLFTEIDDPSWGLDFSWVSRDLFQRDYQGLLRTSWGGVVAYRNDDLAALQKSPDVSHQSMDTIKAGLDQFGVALDSLEEFFRHSTFSMQQPQHKPGKRLIMAPLTPAAIAPYLDDFAKIVRARIDSVVGLGEIDFLNDVARPVVAEFWSVALDIPVEDCRRLVVAAHDFFGTFLLAPSVAQMEAAEQGSQEYIATLVPAVRRTADRGTSSIVDRVVADHAAMSDGPGKPADPFHHFALALLDGFNTLASGFAALMYTLLDAGIDPTLPRDDVREFAMNSFLEASRLHPPVGLTMRDAINDLVHDDVLIPAGTTVLMCWMLGNRDPAYFPDADTFLLQRENRIRQYTFSGGAYVCPGRNVFQVLGQALLTELSTAGVRVETTGAAVWSGGSIAHELSSLPVAFARTHETVGATVPTSD